MAARKKSKKAQLAEDRKKFAQLTKPAVSSSDIDRMTSRMRTGAGGATVRPSQTRAQQQAASQVAGRGRAMGAARARARARMIERAQADTAGRVRRATAPIKKAEQSWDRYGLNYSNTLGSKKAKTASRGTTRARKRRG